MSSLMDLINSKRAAIASSSRAKTIKPKEGRNRFRILPRWDGDTNKQFWQDFGQHFIKDSAGQIVGTYICTDKTFNRPCDVCSGIKHAMSSVRDDGIVKLLKDANAGARVLVNALWIDSEKPNEPQILELAPGTFNQILTQMTEWGSELVSLDKGRDIIIERTGSGLSTKYTAAPAAQQTAVSPAILAHAANLEDYVKQESNEGLTKAINGIRSVAGLLGHTPAPAPAALSLSLVTPDAIPVSAGVDLYAAATPAPAAAVAAPAPWEPAAPAVAAAPVSQPVAAVVNASAGTGDAELDALLADLPIS